jgi:hypothetical protein
MGQKETPRWLKTGKAHCPNFWAYCHNLRLGIKTLLQSPSMEGGNAINFGGSW